MVLVVPGYAEMRRIFLPLYIGVFSSICPRGLKALCGLGSTAQAFECKNGDQALPAHNMDQNGAISTHKPPGIASYVFGFAGFPGGLSALFSGDFVRRSFINRYVEKIGCGFSCRFRMFET